MIISNSKKYIFCHIHKTAGEAITSALADTFEWNDIVLGTTSFGRSAQALFEAEFGLSKHTGANQIKAVVGEAVWSEYFSFSVVRHPVDRMGSLYSYLKKIRETNLGRGMGRFRHELRMRRKRQGPWNWPVMIALNETNSFDEFLHHPKFIQDSAVRSQWSILTDADNGQLLVDFVGKFENLDASFEEIKSRIGAPDAQLKKVNASKKIDKPIAGVTDETKEFIFRLFEDDFKQFGYELT